MPINVMNQINVPHSEKTIQLLCSAIGYCFVLTGLAAKEVTCY